MKVQIIMPIPSNVAKHLAAWFREAFQGVEIFVGGDQKDPSVYEVPTPYAIGRLRGSSRKGAGAAYFFDCCLASKVGPTMSFPRIICDIIPEPSSGGGMGG